MTRQTESKAVFKAIFEAITDAIVVTDPQRRIVLVNPAFTKTFGYRLEEIAGQTTELIYADAEAYLEQGRLRYHVAADAAKPVYETSYRRRDGSTFPGETLGAHIRDKQGELLGFIGVIRDVSERVAAQQQLRESEERFRALHDATFGGVLIHDNGLILDCNQGLAEITGYERSQLIGMDGLRLIAEASLDTVLHNIRSGYSERYEVEGVRRDGSVYPLSIKGKNVSYRGHSARVIEFRDITAEKEVAQALSESEERFRRIFETNPDPVILARLDDGTILDVNRAFEEVTGISRLEALGHNSGQLGLWRDPSLREPFLNQLREQGEVRNFEAEFFLKDRQIKTGLLSASIITLGTQHNLLLTVRDITQQKAAEQALVEMDKLKSDFISTAAHELRTPLTAIMGFTELLLDPPSGNRLSEEEKRGYLHNIQERSEALDRMLKDFLDLTRIESGLPLPLLQTECAPEELLEKVVDFYRLREADYIFELDLPQEPAPPLVIDRQRIFQVLENLLSNAVKYSPKWSRVVIRGQTFQDSWEICIEDQGIGMNPQQVERIFDKFYRAEPNGKVHGLGLGMSITRDIVEAHGGKIRVESAPGQGTRVSVRLPYRSPAAVRL